jgi:glycosyltransferase involved in cell wall biosynthesis
MQPILLKCKSVVTIHDLNFYNLSHLMSPLRRAMLRYHVTQSANAADHIMTVSEFSKRQIVDLLGVSPEKITVTHNAVRQRPAYLSDVELLKQKYGIGQPYIIALSSQSPHKNMGKLVDAFTLLNQRRGDGLKLVLVGHRPNKPGDLTRALNESSARDAVIFTGYVPDADLAGLYAHSEAFAFPSVYEGFGIPILEAFTYGTPVVCSNAASIPEVAGDAAAYFNPYDIEETAKAIDTVLSNNALREELICRGKTRAKTFTWKNAATKTLEVYRNIAGVQ